jgi:hypothetical protein
VSRRRRPQHFRPQQFDREQARRQMDGPGEKLIPLVRGREIDAGDLSGDYVEPVQASFGYFGKRFRVNPDLTETMVVDLLEKGEEIEVDDPRQLIAAKDYVCEHIHPADFEEFWETAKSNRQGIHDVMRLCWRLLEQVTDRPTTPPSGSSDGRRDTPTNLPAGASAPAIESAPAASPAQGEGNLQQVAAHFIDKYEAEGRPDKAAQIALAAESRAARGLVTV